MLEKAIALAEDQTDLELALADWRWYFGRRGAAKDVYRELYESHPELFSVAQALPQGLTAAVTSRADPEARPSSYRFTVNKLGKARDLSLQAGSGEGTDPNRIRKALRDIRFRPSLDSKGEVVESEVVGSFRYLR